MYLDTIYIIAFLIVVAYAIFATVFVISQTAPHAFSRPSGKGKDGKEVDEQERVSELLHDAYDQGKAYGQLIGYLMCLRDYYDRIMETSPDYVPDNDELEKLVPSRLIEEELDTIRQYHYKNWYRSYRKNLSH